MSAVWRDIWPIMADTHCHPHDYSDPASILQESLSRGMRLHQMTLHPQQYLEMSEHELYHSAQIHTCLGLYPLGVDVKQKKLQHLLELLPHTHWVGEIGLDASQDNALQFQAQLDAFKNILQACNHLTSRILSVHSRRAAGKTLELCSEDFSGTIILHWYSGPLPNFESMKPHLYFSVNTTMLKSRQSKQLLDALPLNRILLESDGPYILRQNQSVKPWQLTSVIEALAHRHSQSILEMAKHIHQNYLRSTQCLPTQFQCTSP